MSPCHIRSKADFKECLKDLILMLLQLPLFTFSEIWSLLLCHVSYLFNVWPIENYCGDVKGWLAVSLVQRPSTSSWTTPHHNTCHMEDPTANRSNFAFQIRSDRPISIFFKWIIAHVLRVDISSLCDSGCGWLGDHQPSLAEISFWNSHWCTSRRRVARWFGGQPLCLACSSKPKKFDVSGFSRKNFWRNSERCTH